jgi:hypothetical protein
VRAQEQEGAALPDAEAKKHAQELCDAISSLQEVGSGRRRGGSGRPVQRQPSCGSSARLPCHCASARSEPPSPSPHPLPRCLPLPQRIDREVGPREMTVRQMLHHTALRSRQASLSTHADPVFPHAAAAGGSSRRRSEGDVPGAVAIDMPTRRAAKEGAPWGLESVQSMSGEGGGSGGGAVVDPRDDVATVQAVTALARALSSSSARRSSSASGGQVAGGSGGAGTPRSGAGAGADGFARGGGANGNGASGAGGQRQ